MYKKIKKNLSNLRQISEDRFLRRLGFPKLKQEALLVAALKDEGVYRADLEINVDHDLGINYINGIPLPIIYPKSHFNDAYLLLKNAKKSYDFYFNGNASQSGDRKRLLSPFEDANSKIIYSNEGRKRVKKAKFNNDYYSGLASAHYGLCPHQLDWPGCRDNLWTYRFIECCMVGTVPVCFRETPLGESFVKDFFFVWDDWAIDKRKKIEPQDMKRIEFNFEVAFRRFTLSESLMKNL